MTTIPSAPHVSDVAAATAIVRLNTAYTAARTLHSAVELGLFEMLAEGPATLPQIRERLGLHPRMAADFLDALVGLGLLLRDDDGGYANALSTAKLLVPGTPDYIGGTVAKSARHHYTMWGALTEALRDGRPRSAGLADKEAMKRLYGNPEATREFLGHMDAHNGFCGREVARCVDWGRHRSFVDVGGARGNVAAQIVGRHPHLLGGVFDLPALEPHFDEHVARLGVADRVTFHPGDFFADELPETDVVVIGHVLHDWPVEVRQMVIEKAFRATRPGGFLVVYDQMIDEDRRDPHPLLTSLNVRLVREGGSEYAVAEIRDWAEKAGYRFAYSVPVATIGDDTVFVAAKD
ncbi:acetylserotonin O-methyltransferase [Sphaerisporangium perillae]|uniref:acetylserotonin O-methyltransferase n=1 Tax=Sphaerisporangium perillae TaxID=2935860 RepID=UPI00200FF01F|nr:acetylserotonin O-methyltransferase [Sphaerisporangium perillae]